MLMPSIYNDDLFDDWFDDDYFWPAFEPDLNKMDRKVFGKRAANLMKTDVKETENGYEVAVDLPGFKKEDITCQLKDGYLTISAEKNHENEEKNKEGKFLRRERYAGSVQRSFYVGKEMDEKNIHASFKDGVLTLGLPKMEEKKPEVEEKHMVEIQ
ncbi:MAG: Hsp20/alpha crystallin family protein [Eubacterium sp.]|nr:Hsp20/alpha crystallin family protein [Eubacterium sp.]